MAEIPYAAPTHPEIQVAHPEEENPQALAQGYEAVARDSMTFGDRLIHLEQQQQLNQGKLYIDQQIRAAHQKIIESGDYKNAGPMFDSAVQNIQDHIEGAGYNTGVTTELSNYASANHIAVGSQIDSWAFGQMRQDNQRTLQNGLNQNETNYAYASPAQRTILENSTKQTIAGQKGISYTNSSDGQAIYQGWLTKAQTGAAVTDLQANPVNTVSALQNPQNYAAITPETRAELISRGQAEIKRRQDVNKSQTLQIANNQIESEYTQGQHDPTTDAQVAAGMGGNNTPAFKQYQQQIQIAHQGYSSIQNMISMTPQNAQAYADELKPKAGADNYDLRWKVYQNAEDAVGKIAAAREADPAALVTDKIPPTANLTQRVQLNLANEAHIGIPQAQQQILSSSDYKSYAQQLSTLPPDQQMQQMRIWQTQVGTNHQAEFMQGMINAGVQGYWAEFGSVPDSTFIELSNAYGAGGAKVLAKSLPPDDGTGNPLTKKNLDAGIKTQMSQIQSVIPPAFGGTKQLQDDITTLAYSKAASGDPNAVADAAKELFPYSIQNAGGKNWAIPKQMTNVDPSTLNDSAQNKMRNTQFLLPKGATQQEYQAYVERNAQPVLSGNSYYFYVNGTLVRNANGTPFTMTMGEALSQTQLSFKQKVIQATQNATQAQLRNVNPLDPYEH